MPYAGVLPFSNSHSPSFFFPHLIPFTLSHASTFFLSLRLPFPLYSGLKENYIFCSAPCRTDNVEIDSTWCRNHNPASISHISVSCLPCSSLENKANQWFLCRLKTVSWLFSPPSLFSLSWDPETAVWQLIFILSLCDVLSACFLILGYPTRSSKVLFIPFSPIFSLPPSIFVWWNSSSGRKCLIAFQLENL